VGRGPRSRLGRARVTIPDSELAVSLDIELPAQPAIVWEYLTSPTLRLLWQSGTIRIVEDMGSGRRGAGTVNHCIHGKAAVVEEILDWRPFDYVTLNSLMPIPGAPKLKSQQVLEPLGDDRTLVHFRFGRPRSAKDRAFLEAVLPEIGPQFQGWLATLAEVLTAEMERRRREPAVPEPEVPASAARFLTEPVHAGVDSGFTRSSSS